MTAGRLGRRLLLAATPVLMLGVLELGLRLSGRPRGTYRPYFRLLAARGAVQELVHLHQPSRTESLKMFADPYKYTLHINSLGLRGREVRRVPEPGIFRIVCIGDSITDGMYVSDPYSFPGQLHGMYQESGRPVEVLNVGQPGAGIHKEVDLLSAIGLPLFPSLVILTFVTNDLFDAAESLDRSFEAPPARGTDAEPFLEAVVAGTAIGEWLMDQLLERQSSKERRTEILELSHVQGGEDQLDLEENGTKRGAEFVINCRKFRERHRVSDDKVVNDVLPAEVLSLWETHRLGLEIFVEQARRAEVKVAVAFFPAYPQIYEDPPGCAIQALLEEECGRLDVPFLDLTDDFRAQRDQVLHYAPIDFHLNRRGNKVLAEALMNHLDASGLVPR